MASIDAAITVRLSTATLLRLIPLRGEILARDRRQNTGQEAGIAHPRHSSRSSIVIPSRERHSVARGGFNRLLAADRVRPERSKPMSPRLNRQELAELKAHHLACSHLVKGCQDAAIRLRRDRAAELGADGQHHALEYRARRSWKTCSALGATRYLSCAPILTITRHQKRPSGKARPEPRSSLTRRPA